MDFGPVNTQSIESTCRFIFSPWRIFFWAGYSRWIGSTERCWLSFQSSEDSPVPSCMAAWSPGIRAFLFVTCVAAFFLPLTFPHCVRRFALAALERLYYVISSSVSGPCLTLWKDLLCWDTGSCRAVVCWVARRRRSAVKWSLLRCIAGKVTGLWWLMPNSWASVETCVRWRACWIFITRREQLVSALSPTMFFWTAEQVGWGFSGISKWFSCRVTVNQAWQEVCVVRWLSAPRSFRGRVLCHCWASSHQPVELF